MKRNDLIDLIFEYQEDKNNLAIKHFGIELIPENYQLSRKEIEKNLELILEKYSGNNVLAISNCLHCNIWYRRRKESYCAGCPYYENDDYCMYENSTYSLVRNEAEKRNNDNRFYEDIETLSFKLEKDIDEYLDARQQLSRGNKKENDENEQWNFSDNLPT